MPLLSTKKVRLAVYAFIRLNHPSMVYAMPIRLRAKSPDFGAGHATNKGTIRVQIPCLAANRIGMVYASTGEVTV